MKTFLAATACCAAALAAGCRGAQDGPSHLSAEIPNFAKVSDTLYRGGKPTARGCGELKKMGVRTIVSLRVLPRGRGRMAGHGFKYNHISFKHVHPELEDVLEFLAIATDQTNHPVFVHCRKGADRTGMMVAAYRMVVQDWPREKAIEEMKRMGFHEINEPIEDFIEDMDVADVRRRLAETAHPKLEVIP
jgi:tyrosine-protein phosphatase SIW14